MTAAVLTDTLVLGALTGMRSMSGPAILAAGRGGVLPRLALTLAAGEMVADKTEAIGDRIDPLPLGGRAAMGALVGGIIAHDRRGNRVLGAALGALINPLVALLPFVDPGLAEDANCGALISSAR